jgi:membrane-bound lytic murein transglycosylase D
MLHPKGSDSNIRDRLMKNILSLALAVTALVSCVNDLSAQSEPQYIRIVPQNTPIPIINIDTNPSIEQFIGYYKGRGRMTLKVWTARSGRNEKMVRRIFREEGVPEDLFRLPQLREACVGSPRPLWTFIPKVASRYGLRRTKYLDETKSFEKATRATAQYLKFLGDKYNRDWALALGAYESGEGNVDLALERTKAKDYWTIYKKLPLETRNFPANVFAIILIANNPQKYGFADFVKDLPIEYELARVPPSVSLERIADYSRSDLKTIKQLNPELIASVTPPEPYVIRVPPGSGRMLADRLRKLLSK